MQMGTHSTPSNNAHTRATCRAGINGLHGIAIASVAAFHAL